MLLLSEKLMSCCAAGTNGCLDLRCRATALNGQVSTEWSRCPGSMARRPRDSVAPLRWSSAGWMPARIGRLSTGVSIQSQFARRHWWWGQWGGYEHCGTKQERGTLQSNGPGVAVCNVVAPAPQPEPASRLRSATRDVSFLQSDSRCWQYVSDLSNVTSRYLDSEKGRVSLAYWSNRRLVTNEVCYLNQLIIPHRMLHCSGVAMLTAAQGRP